MALGVLTIIFIALVIATIISILGIILKRGKYVEKNAYFNMIVIIAIINSIIAFSALANNFVFAKVCAILWIVLALISVVIKKSGKFDLARVILLAAVAASMIQNFIF